MSLRKSAAFTMIELSVVLFIIGLLAVTMGPSVMEFMFKGEKSATQSTMTGIKAALANFCPRRFRTGPLGQRTDLSQWQTGRLHDLWIVWTHGRGRDRDGIRK